MEHQEFKELIVLLKYSELSAEDESRLKAHLQDCSECRAESAALGQMHTLLAAYPGEVPDEILPELREEAMAALRAERRQVVPLRQVSDSTTKVKWRFDWQLAPALLRYAAILFVGLLIGYLASAPPAETDAERSSIDPFASPDVQLANVQFVQTDPVTQEVELSFNAARRFTLKGNADDPRIQRLLTYALVHEQNPGTRLLAVQEISDRRFVPGGQDVRDALITALKSDENAAVRQKALAALQQLPMTSEVREALLFSLANDPNPKVRIEIINAFEQLLAQGQPLDTEVRDVLEKNLQSEENSYIRHRTEAVLREVSQQ